MKLGGHLIVALLYKVDSSLDWKSKNQNLIKNEYEMAVNVF